ncbi:MAG: hypothetical protein L3J56_13850 [Bacteroidales bacterium]|nr:hypothetical protein [Bacteroidales bacterium]
MKKILFFIGFFFIGFISFSQVFVDGVNINESNTRYCQLKRSVFGVYIDYGQEKVKSKAEITDKNGNHLKNEKTINVLNFMDENGWELTAFSRDNASDSPSKEVYIFKKK